MVTPMSKPWRVQLSAPQRAVLRRHFLAHLYPGEKRTGNLITHIAREKTQWTLVQALWHVLCRADLSDQPYLMITVALMPYEIQVRLLRDLLRPSGLKGAPHE
jgi:hypothetical protein